LGSESAVLLKLNFVPLHTLSRVAQRFQDILAFQIGVFGKNLFDGATGAQLPDNHSNRYPQAADARLATHHGWRPSNSAKRRHVIGEATPAFCNFAAGNF
jgi:hypothetical protein